MGDAQEGGDVQIHFSITQLTAPWENKSKKCATLKCVHAARDIFNVNPVVGIFKVLNHLALLGKRDTLKLQNKQILMPSPSRKAEWAVPATPPWQGTAAPTLRAYLAIFSLHAVQHDTSPSHQSI